MYSFRVDRIDNYTLDDTQENGDQASHEYTLKPCDKVATLYVMQQKMDSPIYNIPE